MKDTDTRGPGKIDLKLPRLSDVIGRHRADDTTPSSSRPHRSSSACPTRRSESPTRSRTQPAQSIPETTTSRARHRARAGRPHWLIASPPGPGGFTAPAPPDNSAAIQTNNVVANQFANPVAAAKDWMASPRALAGRAVDTPTVPRLSTLWTPPRILAPLGTMKAAPGTSPTTGSTSLLTTVLSVFNPLAGNSPTAPGVDTPLAFVMAGAARREIGVDSFASLPLLAPTTDSLTYAPDPSLEHGVITGTNAATPTGLTYLVANQPSGGGKVYLDPTTGNYAYLPDLKSVQQPDATETFSVVVVQPTAFTSAITGVPLIGSLASQVLVVLYRIPVVNVVLSPIIGRSEITDVSLKVSDFKDEDDLAPIAFTTKIPSPKDGTLISINYFPSYAVADDEDGLTTAPTILNGPGLATAGNIDPNADISSTACSPGLHFLRNEGGYNVVTWDPRGESNPAAPCNWIALNSRVWT